MANSLLRLTMHRNWDLTNLTKAFFANNKQGIAIVIAIKVRTDINGPNDHVPVIAIGAYSYSRTMRELPSAFCYSKSVPIRARFLYAILIFMGSLSNRADIAHI
jgi:hypothetical protein